MTIWHAVRDRLLALRGPSREREVAVQAVKAGFAAVVALLATFWFGGGPSAFLAPYAAVLAVTSTVRGSWTGAVQQAGVVLTGVLLAFAVAAVIPPVIAAVPVATIAGLLLGRWRGFGTEGYWVAVTALILLVNGVAERLLDLGAWVAMSVTGSLIGAVVNTLLLPPVHLRDADDAVRALTRELATQLRTVADQVRAGWSAADAERWARSARGLRRAVRRADDAVWHGRESVRWNPRRRLIRRIESPLAVSSVVDRLSRVSERVLQVSVLLGDLAGRADRDADPALADLLERLVHGVDVMAEHPDGVFEALAGPPERVRGLRADSEVGPDAVRGACMVTLSDALTELATTAR